MLIDKAFFSEVARAAAAETLPRFRQFNEIDNKYTSGFDPVTEADRAAERAIHAVIGREFPEHGILGEEYGPENIDRSHVWVIDPIDGTRAFISGLPVWGTLVGLTVDGDAKAGMMSQSFTGELFYSDGEGAYLARDGVEQRLSVRSQAKLEDATMFTTTPSLFKGELRKGFDSLENSVRLSRYGVDCYAFAMLAGGFADIVVEAGLQPYDIVALIPIIEQAGGVVTQRDGGPAEKGGDIVAAASIELHQAALELINS
ncbi:histidinol-phosphatase [Brucella thiophenivorans]|uniref:Histidinol-phosphatase n=1 Tax=Brucella thiophenivorans TaxID=571255 RepID=A0A256EZ59_9HYPH|nr:histidinol-phosphatase [Brucella thiophenivorans]OYR07451.1 histidinol-phosphatase [Brucella thiophenivorans]